MKNSSYAAAAALLSLTALEASATRAVPGSGPALVIRGATLIDGNGGTPLTDAVVVMLGDRITAVGGRGQVTIPAGAKIIEASGKYLTPGLIDAKSGYNSAYGEIYMTWGVTSAVVSGGLSDAGVAERDAINHGMFAGPRLFLSYASISGPGADGKKEVAPLAGRYQYIAHNPEEARQLVRQFYGAGADIIYAGDGDGKAEIFAAAVDEAHKFGLGTAMRLVGPGTAAREGAEMGADVLIHSGQAGVQMAKDASRWKGNNALPPDPYADIDEAKQADMIKLLVTRNVTLEPDLIATGRGFPKNWTRLQQEDATFYSDPKLLSYTPKIQIAGVVENVKSASSYLDQPALDLRARGFRNQAAFLKRFVDAGGHLVAASDVPQSPPAFGVLQEMAVFQEDVGLTPMQALQSATKWAADGFKLKDVGVVAPGKLADLVILDADPTVTILNQRKISAVIKAGKIVDRTYHRDYLAKTFRAGLSTHGAGMFNHPTVEDGYWLMTVKKAVWNPSAGNAGFGFGSGGFDSEIGGTPGIESIFPYTLPAGTSATLVTLRGFNFNKASQLLLDGKPYPAKVVSRTEIAAMIDQSLLAKPGRYMLQVRNPGALATPEWGDTSNPAGLLVPYAFTGKFSKNKF